MLRSVPVGAFPRVLAALVAVALSGAPRLASALRPEAPHVCQCRSHGEGHRCACPVCARLARAAARGAVDALPSCHRVAALPDEDARDALAETRPHLEPSCGRDAPEAPAPTGDRYLEPRPPSFSAPRGVEPVVAPTAGGADFPAVPDVPPPKGA